MPATPTQSAQSAHYNYCFIMKCLAGVALFGFVVALLSKPTYIVATAAATLAPVAASAIFFPFTALLTLAAIVALSVFLASTVYVVTPTPTYWFGTGGWADYTFRGPVAATYHTRSSGLNTHTHDDRRYHNHGMFPSAASTHEHTRNNMGTASHGGHAAPRATENHGSHQHRH